jgi:N-acetylglucosamine malate deacetylase 2
MPNKSDVIVFVAHPDDEIFVSGTICLCAERGFRITLVSATDGEGGCKELFDGEPNLQLGQVRRQEIALSARILRASEVLFLSQADIACPDGGGEGVWDQPGLVNTLGRIIEERSPQLILTHGPDGGYGNLAHKLVYKCVMAAVRGVSFSGSVFSFCGRVRHAFFSWHFDQPSQVQVDARGFLQRRAASLGYHQSQAQFFLQPQLPRTIRKYLSALFGLTFALAEVGRKRVPIVTATRFFRKFPKEGLVLQKAPEGGRPHFFLEHYANDERVQIDR